MAYALGNIMNEAPLATREVPAERNVLRFIVWMVDMNPPLLARGSASGAASFLTGLERRKAKGRDQILRTVVGMER